jgi:hypothetical protein
MNWLNAFEYHRDQDKRARLDWLLKRIPTDVSRAIFLMLLIDKAKAVLRISDIVETVLRKGADS